MRNTYDSHRLLLALVFSVFGCSNSQRSEEVRQLPNGVVLPEREAGMKRKQIEQTLTGITSLPITLEEFAKRAGEAINSHTSVRKVDFIVGAIPFIPTEGDALFEIQYGWSASYFSLWIELTDDPSVEQLLHAFTDRIAAKPMRVKHGCLIWARDNVHSETLWLR